jgi:hypothetical protein
LLTAPRVNPALLIQLLALLPKSYEKVRQTDAGHDGLILKAIPALIALLNTPNDALLYHVLSCLTMYSRKGMLVIVKMHPFFFVHI